MELIDKTFFKKILVIDDDEIDRYIAKSMSEKYFFSEEIVLKESAGEALEYLVSLEKTPDLLPQLIFLDINMPVMNGFEFLKKYAELSNTIQTNCTIILNTFSVHPEELKLAKGNPSVARFLNKPLDKEKLEIIKQEFLLKKHV